MGKLTALLQHWRSHGRSGVTSLFENMGFAICRNLHRNTAGWGGEDDRISTKKRLKNASEPSIQAEIAPPPIPNSIFFWGREGPRIPCQTRAYGARERSPVSQVFRVPPFQTLATSLSTDLLAGFKGPLQYSMGMVERGGRKGKGGERKGGRKYRVPPSTFEYNLTAYTLSCT